MGNIIFAATGSTGKGFGFGSLFNIGREKKTPLFGGAIQQQNSPVSYGGGTSTNSGRNIFFTSMVALEGTRHTKFQPTISTVTMMISGCWQKVNTRNQFITCMKEYQHKSMEELHYEDFIATRKMERDGKMLKRTSPSDHPYQTPLISWESRTCKTRYISIYSHYFIF